MGGNLPKPKHGIVLLVGGVEESPIATVMALRMDLVQCKGAEFVS